MRLALAWFASLGAASCVVEPDVDGAPTFEETILESQCGDVFDVQDVETYDGSYGPSTAFVDRYESAVGYLVGVGCSGTLISRDLFLSAGHCNYRVGHDVRFDYQRDGKTGAVKTGHDYRVEEVIEQVNDADIDYAIVRLAGNPGDTWGYRQISVRDTVAGDRVTLMGHPQGVPKVISAGPRTAQASSEGAGWFRHQADSDNGSSGSGVLSDEGLLIGVHTNGGCNVTEPIDGNSAVRVEWLIEYSEQIRSMAILPPSLIAASV